MKRIVHAAREINKHKKLKIYKSAVLALFGVRRGVQQ